MSKRGEDVYLKLQKVLHELEDTKVIDNHECSIISWALFQIIDVNIYDKEEKNGTNEPVSS